MNRLVNFLQEDLEKIENVLNLYYSTGEVEERKFFSGLLDFVYYWQRHSNSFVEGREDE